MDKYMTCLKTGGSRWELYDRIDNVKDEVTTGKVIHEVAPTVIDKLGDRPRDEADDPNHDQWHVNHAAPPECLYHYFLQSVRRHSHDANVVTRQ